MSALCVICPSDKPRRTEPGSHTCERCLERIGHQLREIADYAATLSVMPGAGGAGRRAPGFGSRSPGKDDVIVALDYRSRPGASVHRLRDPRDEDDNPIRSILGTLHGIADWVRDERGLTRPPEPPTITGEVAFLTRWLDWCAAHTVTDQDGNPQPCIDDIGDDIAKLHAQVRGLSPLGGRVTKVGRCPERLDNGGEEDEPRVCGMAVFAPLTGDTAYCAGGHRWDRDRWLWLGTLIEAAS